MSHSVSAGYGAEQSQGTHAGLAITATENESLLDQIVDQWSSLMAAILWQDRLPEQVRSDWRQRLVGLSFLDPKVHNHLQDLGAEMNRWQHRLTCDVMQLRERLYSLTELCAAYQGVTHEANAEGASQEELSAVTW